MSTGSSDASVDEILRRRRSIRRYATREVSDTLVEELLDCCRHAPSSMNGQPWCFIVVRDPALRARIAEVKNAWCPEEKREYPADFIEGAPVVIAVCVDRERAFGRARETGVLAAAQLMIAACARGLGSVYLTAYRDGAPGLAEQLSLLLGLPESIEPISLIPLGYPDEVPPAKVLRPLRELVHRERHGG